MNTSHDMPLTWNREQTPAELHTLLETLAEEYPLQATTGAATLRFEKSNDKGLLRITCDQGIHTVEYGQASFAGRGVAYALSGQTTEERLPFTTQGILIDCTRTFVLRPDYFRKWMRRLALLGYNMVMVYTKDAYQLPDEPYFGYMRGAYSQGEIREMDAYASRLGIEMIASIQALGHLEPIMRWAAYQQVRDTDNVILADDEKSYALLEKMLRFWSDALGTRRIHLGMDETHDLGRGRFMDLHGYERPFDIYNRHLARLCGICEKYKLKPIIWNDMYFRFANQKQSYYEADAPIPQDVCDAIPKMVRLCYWDYYHHDTETYLKMLRRTRSLNGGEPFMASGIWTWGRLWCDFTKTSATVRPCIDACKAENIHDIVFTMWGDDGGYCEFESVFASMAWAADYANHGGTDLPRIRRLYEAVCHTSYDTQIQLGAMEYYTKDTKGQDLRVGAPSLLWDDPLMAMAWREYRVKSPDIWQETRAHYQKLLALAAPLRDDRQAGQIDYAWNILNVLAQKISLRLALEHAYATHDTALFQSLVDDAIPKIQQALDSLLAAFREQWFRGYKSYGLEIMQIRIGGLRERYAELARRITELLSGKIDHIAELAPQPPVHGYTYEIRYRMLATGGWFV